MVENIHWLGHDSFRIDGSCTVYVDPWKIRRPTPSADVILVTHDHYDHLSPDDIAALATSSTVVVGPAAVTERLPDFQTMTVRPGDTVSAGGATVTAVPAYNIDKFKAPDQVFHPREAGYVGFVIELDGRRIYHAGDTDAIPEMRDVVCDVALLPVSGTYVMTADEAARACQMIRAEVIVPMHYGDIVGSDADAKQLSRLCGAAVEILPLES